MSDKTARLIFWVGTLSSLVLFLVLTVDTTRRFDALTHADKLDEQVVAGKRTFERNNCNDCHTILGFGAYYAPRLAHPEVAFASSYRHMPQQKLSEAEIEDLVAYLRWVSGIDNQDWPPQDSPARWKRGTQRMLASAALSPAAALVEQEGCLACHTLGGEGESRGPGLEWIGARRSGAWIAEYLAEPERFAPGGVMPAYDHLDRGQRQMVGEFIAALAASRGTEP
jgi:nitric oxide reductase subunit C